MKKYVRLDIALNIYINKFSICLHSFELKIHSIDLKLFFVLLRTKHQAFGFALNHYQSQKTSNGCSSVAQVWEWKFYCIPMVLQYDELLIELVQYSAPFHETKNKQMLNLTIKSFAVSLVVVKLIDWKRQQYHIDSEQLSTHVSVSRYLLSFQGKLEHLKLLYKWNNVDVVLRNGMTYEH